MIKIRAHIKLFKNGRRTPFRSGYRPLFNFVPDMKTSGAIELIQNEEFYPGDEGEVIIRFLYQEYLGEDFAAGKEFTFGEGIIALGEGVVLELLWTCSSKCTQK
jgi:GTPase